MIIGIVGFIGSGKSTVGNLLVREYGYQPVAFADNLKDAAASIFGWPRELLEGDTVESRKFRETKDEYWSDSLGWDVTPRKVLQILGTEAGRKVFGDNLWISGAFKRIETQKRYGQDDFVITDCRFPNEIEMIRKHDGKLIWVSRGNDPDWFETALKSNSGLIDINSPEHMLNKYPDVHISEWAWIGKQMDVLMFNNTTIDNLSSDLKIVLDHLHKPTNTNIIITGIRIEQIIDN